MLVLNISFALALADQASKFLVRRHLAGAAPVVLIPGVLDFRYVRNTGAAWGMFEGGNAWLVVLSIIMLVVIVFMRRHLLGNGKADRVVMGLMIGGIAGNVIDRLKLGYVVDFVDFHVIRFPAFNIADSAICCGVGLYILCQITRRKHVDGEPVQAREEGR